MIIGWMIGFIMGFLAGIWRVELIAKVKELITSKKDETP